MVGANESNELCVVLKKDKTKLVFLKTYTKRRKTAAQQLPILSHSKVYFCLYDEGTVCGKQC